MVVLKVSAMPRPAADCERLSDICVVCLCEMKAVDCRLTPCGHVLHEHCLISWLKIGANCPTCKQTIISKNTGQQQTAEQTIGDEIGRRQQQQLQELQLIYSLLQRANRDGTQIYRLQQRHQNISEVHRTEQSSSNYVNETDDQAQFVLNDESPYTLY